MRHRLPQLLTSLLLGLLLTACASTSQQADQDTKTPPAAFSKLTEQTDWYMKRLADSDTPNRFGWEILAMRSLLASGDLKQAAAINQQLAKESYSPRRKSEQQLVQTLLLMGQHQPGKALQLIQAIDARPLDNDATRTLYDLRASLLQQHGDMLQAFNNLLLLEAYLSPEQKIHHHERMRDLLLQLPPGTLRSAIDKPAPDIRSGWLELGLLLQTATPGNLPVQYQQWQQRYPDHPANSLDVMANVKKADTTAQAGPAVTSEGLPERTAILIPLSGPLARNGEALRNGMLAAYKEAGLHGDLRFYDSVSHTAQDLYQQSVQDGAQLIIGPLLKEHVEALTGMQPGVPVLALNEPDNKVHRNGLFYFSLSPAADAEQAAIHINQNNHQLPLVIVPQGAQGQKVADSFSSRWQQLTGKSPLVAHFSTRQTLQDVLKQAMGVGSEQANAATAAAAPAGKPIAKQAFNRTDIDAIYLYASPLEAGIIRSFIEVNQSPYSPAPAYYLAARGNPGYQGASSNQGITGMEVGDMPWMSEPSLPLRDKVLSVWPQTNPDLLRFFAMGYDAMTVAAHLKGLQEQPDQTLDGLTGRLSVDDQGTVRRQLSWHTLAPANGTSPASTTPAATQQP